MKTFKIYDSPTPEEFTNLEAMRSWVTSIESGTETLTSAGKLGLIQRLLDDGSVQRSDTWKLSALGLLFGDALHQVMEGRLKWVIVEDSLGVSPALRWKDSEILIYPISSIRERIQSGEALNVHALFAEFTGMLPFTPR